MYFDGTMNKKGPGIGVILVSPTRDWILIVKRLDYSVTNNVSEYKACICGLEALIAIGIKRVEVLGDSKLVISHVNKEWEVREERFKPYLDYIENLKKNFDEVVFLQITRKNNQVADALTTLAYVWDNLKSLLVRLVILMKARVLCFESTQVLDVVEKKKS